VCCNEPQLLQSAELVHLFGGVGSGDSNTPLSGLVVGHGCIVWLELSFLNIIELTHFMHMLLLYLSYLGYSNDICIYLLMHVCMDSFYMCMYKSYKDVLLV